MLGVTLDCDDIVLIDEPRTYRLIENIMSTVAECFTLRRIHIGMDEAYRVARASLLDDSVDSSKQQGQLLKTALALLKKASIQDNSSSEFSFKFNSIS